MEWKRVEIDPPSPQWSFTPTTAYEVNYLRSYGQGFCIDNGLDAVEFDYSFAHQWQKHVHVTAEGFITIEGLDLSPETEKREVERIHSH